MASWMSGTSCALRLFTEIAPFCGMCLTILVSIFQSSRITIRVMSLSSPSPVWLIKRGTVEPRPLPPPPPSPPFPLPTPPLPRPPPPPRPPPKVPWARAEIKSAIVRLSARLLLPGCNAAAVLQPAAKMPLPAYAR
ncbi:hypothetical protein DQ04_19101000 [Trypanosoma grayi]|uniref:hypothetical protein n=1 Tax=Trypanosoma grayi TaxID=71804 RepID=UPI0004F45C78|nr:hypothetical protein DQ04_19101000 [Trypanosoma grayi]KEG05712.1 hypothetical protein DQ04_19101000 [Trypanosoma grayi]